MKKPAIYIVTNKPFGTLYTGTTRCLEVRSFEHKNKTGSIFAAKYNCTKLVYYCLFDCMMTAIEAEKKLKRRSRLHKIKLIMSQNPEWNDLREYPLPE